jgi:hypothetical protein
MTSGFQEKANTFFKEVADGGTLIISDVEYIKVSNSGNRFI